MALLVAMPVALGFLVWLAKSGGVRFPIIGRTLQELADTSAQLKIRAALVVMIAFVALSEVVGTELVLGAFLAGLAATVISPKHGSAVRVRLDAMGYGFFVPLFFIHAGATLDFGVAFQSLDAFVIAAVFLFLAFLIKMLPAVLTLSPAHGIRSGLSGGALLSANLSLVIAAGAIAEDLGLIDNEMYGALLLMALLSTVLAPLLFNAISGLCARAVGGSHRRHWEQSAGSVDHTSIGLSRSLGVGDQHCGGGCSRCAETRPRDADSRRSIERASAGAGRDPGC